MFKFLIITCFSERKNDAQNREISSSIRKISKHLAPSDHMMQGDTNDNENIPKEDDEDDVKGINMAVCVVVMW